MQRRRGWSGAAALLTIGVLAGCAGAPQAVPTIGAPAPSAAASAQSTDAGAALAKEWKLRGAALPADWPDIPLPHGTDVVTSYAIGADPQRTWTATFASDRGTAVQLARPVVAELRKRGFAPIAEYVGAANTNTGLYSFAGPGLAVYVVLGEDDGRPNLVITARGSGQPSALPTPGWTMPAPSGAPTPAGSPAASPEPGDDESGPDESGAAEPADDEPADESS